MNDIEQIKLEFVGIDDWSRPVFKLPGTTSYFGSINKLCCNENEVKEIVELKDLSYFGSFFNCEPYGLPDLKKGKILEMKSGKKIEPIL